MTLPKSDADYHGPTSGYRVVQLWLIGRIGKILGHSEYWLWAVLVAVIVNVLMTTVLMTLAFPKQSLIQSLTDKLNSITRWKFNRYSCCSCLQCRGLPKWKICSSNDELTRLNLFVNRLMTILNPIMMGISSGLSVAIYWIGAYVINDAAPTARLPSLLVTWLFSCLMPCRLSWASFSWEHSSSFFPELWSLPSGSTRF